MKKAVIYGRVSTQDKQDYNRQLNDLDEWAKKNGYQVAARFGEKITGATLSHDRIEFKKLLAYIEEHKIKMILVSEISRLGRMGVETRVEIEELGKRGINIFFYTSGQFTLKDGKLDRPTMMQVGVVCDLAQMELDRISANVISGLKNSARSGKIQGSKFKAYGFKGDKNKMITVVDAEFEVVKKIFEMFDKGMTTNSITSWLNEQSIPTRYHDFKGTTIRGKSAESYSWNTRTVYRVLTNRMWIGERWHNGELLHTSKPIIDPEFFERVQLKLRTKANKSLKVVKNTNYLKDIIKCQCGLGLFQNIDPKKGNRTYVCNSRAYSKLNKLKYCGNPSVNIDKLYNTLYTILTEQFIKKMKGKPSIDFDEKIELKKIELANNEKALKKNSAKLENLFEASLEVDDNGERTLKKSMYNSMKEKLEKESEVLASSVDELRNEIGSLLTAKNNPLRKFYTKEMFLAEAKNIIQTVTIGKASKEDEKLIVKTKQDIGINVNVQTLNGQSFNYQLSKYSKDILFDGVKSPIVNSIMTLAVNDLITSFKPKPNVRRFKGQ